MDYSSRLNRKFIRLKKGVISNNLEFFEFICWLKLILTKSNKRVKFDLYLIIV